jgi:hypothetical protein
MMKQEFNSFLSIFFEVLPLRAFVTLVFIVVLGSLLLGLFILHQFEAALQLSLKDQGILLAQALEAGISPDMAKDNIKGLQDTIDRFVAAQQNDIEVNIISLKGEKSFMVASNIADNIEKTSKEEHQDLLDSLKSGQPVFFISEGEDEEEEEEEDDEKEKTPSLGVHGEVLYDFPDNRRFMSITTPIIVNGKGLGSINVKLSLVPLDKKLDLIHWGIWIATFFEIILVLIGIVFLFNYFLKAKSKLQEEESIRLKAEMKALQSQVNPHFLFNTLNTISNLIATDPPLAEKLISNMAFLYRNIVGAGKKEWWTIEEEMKIVKTYLEIESVRFCDKMKYDLDISPDVVNLKIPCLLIQPLVENSIKHAISPSVAGGEIKVTISKDKELMMSVEDKRFQSDKYPTIPSSVGEKTGIENIKRRLELLYGDKAKFEFQILEDGAKAKIVIGEDFNE